MVTTPGKQTGIEAKSPIFSVAFQRTGNIVGGSLDNSIRIWRTDGKEVGRPIKVGSTVRSVATSKDGRWIVCGGDGGLATICNASTHDKVIEVKGHTYGVIAIDISPDSKMFATGSHDRTAIIWNIPAAQQLVGPLEHKGPVSGVIFSPDGVHLATATQNDLSIHIFDSHTGNLKQLIHVPHAVRSVHSAPIEWSNDGQYIFTVYCGQIKKLEASTGTVLSAWTVHHGHGYPSIALARSDRFIAYSTAKPPLVSLWDVAAPHARLGPIITCSGDVRSIALSLDGTCLAAGQYDNKITLRNLTDILPPSFLNTPPPSPCGTTGALSTPEEQSGSLERDPIPDPCDLIAVRIPPAGATNTDGDVVMKVQQAIRKAVEQVTQDSPHILIDTTSGLLLDKVKQQNSFTESETCEQLIASMTLRVDQGHIQQTVAEYYKYTMLSHKWDGGEPDFQTMKNASVYGPSSSLTREKLRMFCSRARYMKLRWAWSDTCCIDQKSSAILQESLISMFKWYRGSALTIVYLRGVEPHSHGLVDSPWNTRAWTYQEYLAAKVIQFYSEDWTPYLDLPVFDSDKRIFNHKTSPQVVQEMSQVIRNQVGDGQWPELQPGLDHIREKLCLASTRQATRVEDVAYSLFGILSTNIPIMYGEGEKALGRFLAQVLESSRDVSILAWTGTSGEHNSCLPAHINVFKELATSYLPQPFDGTEPKKNEKRLRPSRPERAVMKLYGLLNKLPRPWFTGLCMHLPCITFPLKQVSRGHAHEPSVYHAKALGNVKIATEQDLSKMKLVLVHPWIDSLLDHKGDDDAEAQPGYQETRALWLVARLRRPFSALLLAQRLNKPYKRVAADSKITVRVQTNVDLVQLSNDVRTLEVL